MNYFSLSFAILLSGLFVVYFIVPKQIRWICLLAASYVFYYFAGGVKVIGFLLFTTLSVFLCARILGRISADKNQALKDLKDAGKEEKNRIKAAAKRKKGVVLAMGLLSNLGILAVLKYAGFVVLNLSALFDFRAGTLDMLLPLGISFYTFQATGYLVDVYRGKYEPDKNPARFALFLSFFPQIVQGPIGRYDQLADQLVEGHSFDVTRIKHGIQLILWGFFQKLVIADRISVLADYMLDHPEEFTGFKVAIGVLAITLRIYADFSGGIDISIGIAQIFGIRLAPNFERPYFAVSIADHWRRWHITLGAWFRDYVYYPLTLSKPFFSFNSWARKNLGKYLGRLLPISLGMGISFFLVGVWHGAAWKFVAFGLYNSIIIMAGMIFTPWLQGINEKYHLVKTDALSWRMFLIFITFILIAIGKLITGARTLSQAISLFRAMFSEYNPWIFFDGSLYEMGLDFEEFSILILSLVVLFVVDLIRERGIRIRETLDTQNLYFRWLISILAIFSVVIFGVYGSEVARDFIYQQF